MIKSYPSDQYPNQRFISSNQTNDLTEHFVICGDLCLPEPPLHPLDQTDYLILVDHLTPLFLVIFRIFINLLVIHVYLCLSARP